MVEREYNQGDPVMKTTYTPVYIGPYGIHTEEVDLGDGVWLREDNPTERLSELRNQLKEMSESALDLFPQAASVEVRLTGEMVIEDDSDFIPYNPEDS